MSYTSQNILIGASGDDGYSGISGFSGYVGADAGWVVVFLGSDQTSTSASFSDVGLSFSAEANKTYSIEAFYYITIGATTSMESLLRSTYSGSSDNRGIVICGDANFSSTSKQFAPVAIKTSDTSEWKLTGSLATLVRASYDFTNGGGTSTVRVRFRRSSGSGDCTMKEGSFLIYKKLN